MFKKLIAVSLLLVSLTHRSSGQTYTAPLPQILPASPEASAFVKAGVGNVNMSTGAASASIPLYTIKLKDYSFPISLSYSTQGLKSDEASSRVGLGWVLNATGMITRSVKGKPDEFAARLSERSTFSGDATSLYNYCMDGSSATTGGDTQPDEFSFNVNGYSGKFVLDSNYVPRVTATSNVKITMVMQVTPGSTSGAIDNIYLVTPDGINYKFGTYEKTTDHNILMFSMYKNVTRTAFFLDRIKLPTGDSIVFNYGSISTRAVTGVTQTLQVPIGSAADGVCVNCSTQGSYSSQQDKVEYDTKYLTNISSSNGINVDLTYESRPDMSYDNRLKTLEVTGLKKFIFNYYDVTGSSSQVTGRFLLTKLQDLKNMGDVPNADSSNDYNFTYEQLTSVPLPITFKQDYLGYSTGGGPGGYFIPPAVNASNTIDFSFRNPNWEAAKIGTLTAINYPTGGKEEFIYESNTRSQTIKRNTNVILPVQGNGSSGSFPKYYSAYFTVPSNQTVTLNTYATDYDLGDANTADPTHVSVIAKILEGGTTIASRSSLGYAIDNASVALYTGHTYRVEIEVRDQYVRGFSELTYDSSATAIYDAGNTAIPGVRVKQIRLTDSVSLKSHSKYYTYAGLSNLSVSSGQLGGIVNYESTITSKTFCGDFGAYETDCIMKVFSSSSANAIYSYASSGGLIYYKTVIESDDPNFENGGTEYTFFDNDHGGNHEALLGAMDIPYMSMGQFPALSGQVYTTKIFNKNKEIVQQEVNEYETQIATDHYVNSFYIRKRYEPWSSRGDRMEAFDVIKSHYIDYWIRLKSKTASTYAKGTTQTQKTDFTYNSGFDNISPLATVTTDSWGKEMKTENKYPTDFPADATYQKMVRRNIITPVVQQSSYRNNVLLQQKKTLYKDWFGDSTIIMPEYVQIKESAGATLHNELIFTKYNKVGDPQGVKKTDNIGIVYIWDSLHTLPVAEIKNANFDQVAYAGFENATAYGNWTLSSGAVNTSFVFTGSKAFTGTLTKSITTAGVYTVTLWTKSSATVNSNSGTLVKTVRGWSLYEWILTNPSTITVVGTYIDDLRLHPKAALMTTYTYRPFIGASSMTDPNNNVVYYEYDFDFRLVRIRDIDNSILKQYAYTYKQNVGYSLSTTAAWTATGLVKCNQTGANNNYDGTKVKEEMDMNTSSPTYLQTRFVYHSTPTPPTCAAVSSCTGADKRVVNGGSTCETGVKVFVYSYYSGGAWNCSYYYQWSDGFKSQNYSGSTYEACLPLD